MLTVFLSGDFTVKTLHLHLHYFKQLVDRTPELYPLKYSAREEITIVAQNKKKRIDLLKPGMSCDVHLRAFGYYVWYSTQVNFGDEWCTNYMVYGIYKEWLSTSG